MFIEFHVLQNFTVSNLNRDDTGTPKDCIFGGFRRARISSQCAKRAIRKHEIFKQSVQKAKGDLGVRTKRMIGRVADVLTEQYGKKTEEAQQVAERAIALFGVKRDDKRPDKTSIILYVGENEFVQLASIAEKNWDALIKEETSVENAIQKELRKVVSDERLKAGSYASDIALFGRMVADKNVKNMNVDAACQFAHAISTNEVEMKMDFFTALDDLLPDEEQGSDMMGFVEYNSSCYYRYALINLDILKKNLGYDPEKKGKDQGQWYDPALVEATVEGFARAMCEAVPSGMQNSMAAHNPPSYMRVILRSNGSPWNLANAFVQPVRPRKEEGKDLINLSVKKLETYYNNLKNAFNKKGKGIAFDGIFFHNLHEQKDDKDKNKNKNKNFEQLINELGKDVLKEAKA